MTPTHRVPGPLAWALRLLPSRYRAEHGDELTVIALQAGEDAGRLGGWREAADIAAHALRLRVGLSPDRAAARFIALAAPLAVAIAAGSNVAVLSHDLQAPAALFAGDANHRVLSAFRLVMELVWPTALVAVWLDRWTAARVFAGFGGLLALAYLPLCALTIPWGLAGQRVMVVGFSLSWVLTGLFMAIAPRDLLGSSLRYRRALALAMVTALLPGVLRSVYPYPLPFLLQPQALWLVVGIGALAWPSRNRTAPSVLALAALPLALGQTLPLLHPIRPVGEALLVALVAAGAIAVVCRLRVRASTIDIDGHD
ncbi:hypothetical protein P3T36_006738 [Kitasatospora sp. MAP12-15]|uniref:hypothetical protein n=1 Tax=unclassified Kitasatospora TaxID=2633591 RepID=UPI002475C2CE|nr:hypothetical protein [Kitasatospora sp. MAP12-44]MDH6111558.1 hypothetical protein [Kitasatospora sp. MAP12-44]